MVNATPGSLVLLGPGTHRTLFRFCCSCLGSLVSISLVGHFRRQPRSVSGYAPSDAGAGLGRTALFRRGCAALVSLAGKPFPGRHSDVGPAAQMATPGSLRSVRDMAGSGRLLWPGSLESAGDAPLRRAGVYVGHYLPASAVGGIVWLAWLVSPPDTTLIAAGCTAAGAASVEIIRRLFVSPKERADDQSRFRSELRDEIKDLRERTRSTEARCRTAEIACVKMVVYCEGLRERLAGAFHRIDELKIQAGQIVTPHEAIPPMPVHIEDGNIVIRDEDRV